MKDINRRLKDVEIIIDPPIYEVPNPDGWYTDHTRRVMVLWIDEQHIVDAAIMILTDQNPQGLLRLVESHIPRDSKVLRVTHSWDRRAFGFLLSHPSFPITPEGGIPPDLTSNHNWHWVDKTPTKPT